jgi:hypothetical protein
MLKKLGLVGAYSLRKSGTITSTLLGNPVNITLPMDPYSGGGWIGGWRALVSEIRACVECTCVQHKNVMFKIIIEHLDYLLMVKVAWPSSRRSSKVERLWEPRSEMSGILTNFWHLFCVCGASWIVVVACGLASLESVCLEGSTAWPRIRRTIEKWTECSTLAPWLLMELNRASLRVGRLD